MIPGSLNTMMLGEVGPSAPDSWGTWTGFVSTFQSGDDLRYSGSSGRPAGANLGESIDATTSFSVVAYFASSSDASAVFVALSTDIDNNFTWGAGLSDIEATYVYGATVYRTGGVYSASSMGTVSYPVYVRMRKSGNDLVFESSPDDTTWTTRITRSGIMAGITTVYVKVFFAEDQVRGTRVKVVY